MRLLRFAAIASGAVALLAGGLMLVVRSQIDPEKLRGTIEAEASKALGRKVTCGGVSASYGLAVGISDLKIMDAEGKAPQVSLGFARVAVALAPLAKGQVRLASVSLDGLNVKAQRNADGTLDS